MRAPAQEKHFLVNGNVVSTSDQNLPEGAIPVTLFKDESGEGYYYVQNSNLDNYLKKNPQAKPYQKPSNFKVNEGSEPIQRDILPERKKELQEKSLSGDPVAEYELKQLRKNFIQRLYTPGPEPIKNPDGTFSTHEMSSAEVDGKNIAFPTIIEQNGRLVRLSPDQAIKHALSTGEYSEFAKPEEAQWYAEGGYKQKTILDEDYMMSLAKQGLTQTYQKQVVNKPVQTPVTALFDINKVEYLRSGLGMSPSESISIQAPAYDEREYQKALQDFETANGLASGYPVSHPGFSKYIDNLIAADYKVTVQEEMKKGRYPLTGLINGDEKNVIDYYLNDAQRKANMQKAGSIKSYFSALNGFVGDKLILPELQGEAQATRNYETLLDQYEMWLKNKSNYGLDFDKKNNEWKDKISDADKVLQKQQNATNENLQNKINALSSQISSIKSSGVDLQDEDVMEDIKTLEKERDLYAQAQLSIRLLEEGNSGEIEEMVGSYNVPGKNAEERMANYYGALLHAVDVNKGVFQWGGDTGQGAFGALFNNATQLESEKEGYVDLMQKTAALAPVVRLRRSPVMEDDGAGEVFLKTFAQSFVPASGSKISTPQQMANKIMDAMNYVSAKPTDAGQSNTLKEIASPYDGFSTKDWAQMTGVTTALMADMILASPATGGFMKYTKLGRFIDKAGETGKLFEGDGFKFFDTLGSNKYGRGLTKIAFKGAEEGVKFEIAGEIFDGQENELNFWSGFFGGAISAPISGVVDKMAPEAAQKLLAKVFGSKAPDAAKLIYNFGVIVNSTGKVGGRGIAEVFEEAGNELGNIYRETDSWKEFKTELDNRFGDSSDAFHFAVSTFLMGAAMGFSNSVGQYANAKSKALYSQLNSEDKAKFDEMLRQMSGEIKDATEEYKQDQEEKEGEGQQSQPEPKQPEPKPTNTAPSPEDVAADVEAGNIITYDYENESDVPEHLKAHITMTGDVNGKKQVKVSLAAVLDEYYKKEYPDVDLQKEQEGEQPAPDQNQADGDVNENQDLKKISEAFGQPVKNSWRYSDQAAVEVEDDNGTFQVSSDEDNVVIHRFVTKKQKSQVAHEKALDGFIQKAQVLGKKIKVMDSDIGNGKEDRVNAIKAMTKMGFVDQNNGEWVYDPSKKIDSGFDTGDGNKILLQDGKIKVFSKYGVELGERKSKEVLAKNKKQYIEYLGQTGGRDLDESLADGLSEVEARELSDIAENDPEKYAVEYSKSPIVVAEEIVRQANTNHEFQAAESGGKDMAIANTFEPVDLEIKWHANAGDPNYVNDDKALRRNYFKKGTGVSLSKWAQNANSELDSEDEKITAEDVWDFMLRHPNGVKEYHAKAKASEKSPLKDKFEALTGLKATAENVVSLLAAGGVDTSKINPKTLKNNQSLEKRIGKFPRQVPMTPSERKAEDPEYDPKLDKVVKERPTRVSDWKKMLTSVDYDDVPGLKEWISSMPVDQELTREDVMDFVSNNKAKPAQNANNDAPFSRSKRQSKNRRTPFQPLNQAKTLADVLMKTGFAKEVVFDLDRVMDMWRRVGDGGTVPDGFVYQGVVYITATVKQDTLVHEFGHLWQMWAKAMAPALFQTGMKLIKSSPYYNDVKNDPEYAHLTTEEQIADEALARAIGDAGAMMNTRTSSEKFSNWLKNLFRYVFEGMGVDPTFFEDPEQMTMAEFTNAVAGALRGDISNMLAASETRQAVDAAGKQAATSPENDIPEPTEAQKEAGNYAKGHVTVQGLNIAIENPKGSERKGTDKSGKNWSVTMQHDYGYIKQTEGKDGDHLDVFIGEDPDHEIVYVIDQLDENGKFDEHKVMLGFRSIESAESGYMSNYSAGWKGMGAITAMTISDFKNWIAEGETKKPVAPTVKMSRKGGSGVYEKKFRENVSAKTVLTHINSYSWNQLVSILKQADPNGEYNDLTYDEAKSLVVDFFNSEDYTVLSRQLGLNWLNIPGPLDTKVLDGGFASSVAEKTKSLIEKQLGAELKSGLAFEDIEGNKYDVISVSENGDVVFSSKENNPYNLLNGVNSVNIVTNSNAFGIFLKKDASSKTKETVVSEIKSSNFEKTVRNKYRGYDLYTKEIAPDHYVTYGVDQDGNEISTESLPGENIMSMEKAQPLIDAVIKSKNTGIVDGGVKMSRGVNADPFLVDVVNGFYSPLEKIISETKFDKLPAKQWIDKFAKGEEAKWTGLQDWLFQQQGSVSKSDIQNYLKENRIVIQEVINSESDPLDKSMFTVKQTASRNYDVYHDGVFVRTVDKSEAETESDAIDLIIEEADWDYQDYYKQTKFSEYQLAGEKDNYKEILVTFPVDHKKINDNIKKTANEDPDWLKIIEERNNLRSLYDSNKITSSEYFKKNDEIDDRADLVQAKWSHLIDKKEEFKSTHFDEPNILVHLRINTRTDVDGNKVLFLEEVQSDWGQKGKKEGFKGEELDPSNLTFKVTPDGTFNLYQLYDKRGNLVFELPASKSKGDNVFTKESLRQEFKGSQALELMGKNIPIAPFVTDTNSWVKLGLKVALKEAVRQGVQKIAWTTGEQQNDRYDLSKSVDKLEWVYDKSLSKPIGTLYAWKDGKMIMEETMPENRLEDYIGKGVAENLLKASENDSPNYKGYSQKTITGNEIKVGGKGMKGFYGSLIDGNKGIIGGIAEKVFGQNLGTIEIQTAKNNEYTLGEANYVGGVGVYNSANDMIAEFDTELEANKFIANKNNQTQYSVDITPELREQTMKGLPLMSRGNRDIFGDASEDQTGMKRRKFDQTMEHFSQNSVLQELIRKNRSFYEVESNDEAIEKAVSYIKRNPDAYDKVTGDPREYPRLDEVSVQTVRFILIDTYSAAIEEALELGDISTANSINDRLAKLVTTATENATLNGRESQRLSIWKAMNPIAIAYRFGDILNKHNADKAKQAGMDEVAIAELAQQVATAAKEISDLKVRLASEIDRNQELRNHLEKLAQKMAQEEKSPNTKQTQSPKQKKQRSRKISVEENDVEEGKKLVESGLNKFFGGVVKMSRSLGLPLMSRGVAGNGISPFTPEQIEAIGEIALGKAKQGLYRTDDVAREVYDDLTAAGYAGSLEDVVDAMNRSMEWKQTQNKNLNKKYNQVATGMMSDLRNIVVDYYADDKISGYKQALKTRLASELGISDTDAEALANIIEKDVNTKTKKAAEQILNKNVGKKPIPVSTVKKGTMVDHLVDSILAAGQSSDPLFYANLIMSYYGGATLSTAQTNELIGLAENVRGMDPGSIYYSVAVKQMADFMIAHSPDSYSLFNAWIELYYASILSGPATSLVNVGSVWLSESTMFMADLVNIGAYASRIKKGFKNNALGMALLPSFIIRAYTGLSGLTEARKRAADVYANGSTYSKYIDHLKHDKLGVRELEKNKYGYGRFWGKYNPLNLYKYSGRNLDAQDTFNRSIIEQRYFAEVVRNYFLRTGDKKKASQFFEAIKKDKLGLDAARAIAKQQAAEFESNSGNKLTPRQIDIRTAEIYRQMQSDKFGIGQQEIEDYVHAADIAVFTGKRNGAIGKIATLVNKGLNYNKAIKLASMPFVPFVTIVGNVFDFMLDFTPVYGYARAYGLSATGIAQRIIDSRNHVPQAWSLDRYVDGSAQVGGKDSLAREKQFGRAHLGTALFTALALIFLPDSDDDDPMDNYFRIRGGSDLNNPNDPPYTLWIGDIPIKYENIPMLSIPCALLGNYSDRSFTNARISKEDRESRLALAMFAALDSKNLVIDMSFMEGTQKLFSFVADVMEKRETKEGVSDINKEGTISYATKQMTDFYLGVATKPLPQNLNLIKQIERIFDPNSYTRSDVDGLLAYHLGIERLDIAGQVESLDTFGDPVTYIPGENMLALGHYFGVKELDPEWRWLTAHGAHVERKKNVPVKINGESRMLTPKEWYVVSRIAGSDFRTEIAKMRAEELRDPNAFNGYDNYYNRTVTKSQKQAYEAFSSSYSSAKKQVVESIENGTFELLFQTKKIK